MTAAAVFWLLLTLLALSEGTKAGRSCDRACRERARREDERHAERLRYRERRGGLLP